MPRTLRQSLRELSPIVATATIITTLVVCVIITKARNVYVGGLKWPYFSDMGRDKPAYYVFCIGLSLTAVTIASTWLFNAEFQRRVLVKSVVGKSVSKSVQRLSTTATTLAVVAVVGLPILAICDTSSFPSVHNAAAYAFFLLQTIAVIINTIVTHRIYAAALRIHTGGSTAALATDGTGGTGRDRFLASVRRTFLLQRALFALFFLAFLIYLPIGLAIIKPFKHLTIDECLKKNLGQKYCVDDMNYDTTETKLWNYENDFSANQLRAAAQLACIVTLVGYTLTFKTHDYDSVSSSEIVMSAEP